MLDRIVQMLLDAGKIEDDTPVAQLPFVVGMMVRDLINPVTTEEYKLSPTMYAYMRGVAEGCNQPELAKRCGQAQKTLSRTKDALLTQLMRWRMLPVHAPMRYQHYIEPFKELLIKYKFTIG